MTRRGRVYTPKDTLDYEKELGSRWANKYKKPTDKPVGMEVIIGNGYIDIEIYEMTEGLRPKGVTGDIDNYQKAIQDALNGIAYDDDRQVHKIEVRFEKEAT